MRISAAQLTAHLQHHHLAPIYVFMGDEPLHIQECVEQLRLCARQQGFNERSVLTVDKNFDWLSLTQQTQHLSLFAKRRFWELHLAQLNEAGSQFLKTYGQQPPDDILLALIMQSVDSKKQKSQWFLSLEQAGVIVQLRALAPEDLPAWLQQRLHQHQLQATPKAIALMAQRCSGHLLACAQEIEKLALLYAPQSTLDVEQVTMAFADNARFKIFEWVDNVLMGELTQTTRQFKRLKEEGVEIILLIWILHKEIRLLCRLSHALQAGASLETLFKNHRIWSIRKPIIYQALNRHSTERWQQFLPQLVKLEHMAKGMLTGRCWDELLRLAVEIAGIKFLPG